MNVMGVLVQDLLVQMLAQALPVPDPLSGGSGWLGAGLLGLVLAWLLLKHLPSKDLQMKEFSEQKDRQLVVLTEKYEAKLDSMANTFRSESKEIRQKFEEALKVIMDHCSKEMAQITDALRTELKNHRLNQ